MIVVVNALLGHATEVEAADLVGGVADRHPYKVAFDLGAITSCHTDDLRGAEEPRRCTVCLESGDEYLLDVGVDVIIGLLAASGRDITDLT